MHGHKRLQLAFRAADFELNVMKGVLGISKTHWYALNICSMLVLWPDNVGALRPDDVSASA